MPAVRNTPKSRTLPENPDIRTRLFLGRLQRRGVDAVQKLSASDWETIDRLEAAARRVGTGSMSINGRVR